MKSVNLFLLFVFFSFFLSFFSFSSQQVSAIGITPAIIYVDFSPGYTETFTFTVFGDRVETYVKGDLVDYITLSDITKIRQGENQFSATLSLPAEIEKPGTHTILIGARELPEEAEGEGGGAAIAALAAVQAPIYVKVPYPGKYLEISLEAPNVKLNETVFFKIHLSNLGKEDVSAKGTIEVFDPANKSLAKLETEEKGIRTTEEAVLNARWDTTGQKEGSYRAKAVVAYDGKTAVDEKVFRIGILLIKIINYTKEVQADFRNLFEITVESAWNDRITGIWGDVNVIKDNKLIDSFKTITFDLEPWEIKTIRSYWDTEDIEPGLYDANITLYYDGITTSTIGKIAVVRRLRIELPAMLVKVWIPALIALIIIINIIIWLVLRKRQGKQKKRKRRQKR